MSIPAPLLQVESAAAMTQSVALEVDARALACPLPLLKAKQGLRQISHGEYLRVLATDAGSLKDFVSFAQLTSQRIEGFFEADGVYYYVIRKLES